MSLYRWLKHDKLSSNSDDAANKEVPKELGKSVSRKRGKYNLPDDQCATLTLIHSSIPSSNCQDEFIFSLTGDR